jgi:hypothetical protein
MLRALIFDVDGTLAETEELHRKAFNAAFAEHGIPWQWDVPTYGRLLRITGGKERIAAYADEIGVKGIDPKPIHLLKTEIYNRELRAGGLTLRAGVEDLITRAKVQGLTLAIATTTSRPNIETLLAVTLGADAHRDFMAIVTGEDVAKKKPDPEAYRLALAQLGVTADEAIAFEDSKNGVIAARGAGLRVIVTPSLYTERDDFSEASFIIPTLEPVHLAAIGLADALWR